MVSSSNDKVYILLFMCASTKGVHLELTTTLNVPSFLCTFRRFVGRRGLPLRLLSDNAKTFPAASIEIMKLSRAPEVTTYLTNNRIGFWERLVMQQFTNRWRTGYLLNLPEQSVCNSKGRNDCISVGDIVIVKDDKTNRNFWKLDMVESLLWGGDDIVRAAVVKVVDGKGNQLQRLRRPIQHLIPIEV